MYELCSQGVALGCPNVAPLVLKDLGVALGCPNAAPLVLKDSGVGLS